MVSDQWSGNVYSRGETPLVGGLLGGPDLAASDGERFGGGGWGGSGRLKVRAPPNNFATFSFN